MDSQEKKNYIIKMKFSIKIVHFVCSIIVGGIVICSIKNLFFLYGVIELILFFCIIVGFVIMLVSLYKSTTQITVNPENKTIVKKRFLTKTYPYKCIRYIIRTSPEGAKVYSDKKLIFAYDESYVNHEKIDRMMKQKIQQKSIIEVKSKRELKKLMKEAKRRR